MIPEPTKYQIPEKLFNALSKEYQNMGKNSHVGKMAVEIAKSFLQEEKGVSHIIEVKNGGDLKGILDKKEVHFEVKGTAGDSIAFSKLKVSSKASHDLLVDGMTMLRIINVGQPIVLIYELVYGIHFTLQPEDRWSVKKM